MSPIIEVLVGIIFVFSLLSILVTQINTIISQLLRLRARYLLGAIKDIIQDPEIAAKIVSHPLIRLVDSTKVLPNQSMLLPHQALSEEKALQILNSTVNAVEWINPKTFSNVLLSLVRVDEDKELFSGLLDIVVQMENSPQRRDLRERIDIVMDTGAGIDDLVNAINALPPSPYKKALVDALRDISIEIADKGLETDSTISLMAGIRNIKNQYFKEALQAILSTSKTIEEAEEKIESWFNESMDRTSQAFKRNLRYFSLIIGLCVAVILNVDALYLARTLWEDPVLRSSVAEVAESVNLDELQAVVDEAQLNANSEELATLEEIAASLAAAGQTLNQVQELRIPIGWEFASLSSVTQDSLDAPKLDDARYVWNLIPGNNPNWFDLFMLKLVGIATTMIAVAQGAPFWFGILRQLSGGSTS